MNKLLLFSLLCSAYIFPAQPPRPPRTESQKRMDNCIAGTLVFCGAACMKESCECAISSCLNTCLANPITCGAVTIAGCAACCMVCDRLMLVGGNQPVPEKPDTPQAHR